MFLLPSGAQVVSVITSNAPAPATPDAQDDDVQIRVPAKALDRIYKAVNELAVGLLRLRNQTDDVMARTGAMAQLEVTANQRLLEIERHIQEQGLGRQRAASSAAVGQRVSGPVPAALSEFDALELDHYNELTGSTQAATALLLIAAVVFVPLLQKESDSGRETEGMRTFLERWEMNDLQLDE